jgi:hypothetical protein
LHDQPYVVVCCQCWTGSEKILLHTHDLGEQGRCPFCMAFQVGQQVSAAISSVEASASNRWLTKMSSHALMQKNLAMF